MQLRRGREINELWLARQLAPYGIRPRTVRIGTAVAKGYMEDDFVETFRRYIPASEVDEMHSRARRTEEGRQESALRNGSFEI